ncbi:transposable element Tcb1 transposase [Trichonephila clavipes]|nr:transposable element Tcb1 transposase [Trichonephila clavipes]
MVQAPFSIPFQVTVKGKERPMTPTERGNERRDRRTRQDIGVHGSYATSPKEQNSSSKVKKFIPEEAPFSYDISGAIFQQENARPHVAKTIRDFCSAQHMQLLLWPACSPDMSTIEYVWSLVGRHFSCHPCPASSKDELLLCIQAIWNSLPQADIQNLFDSMPRRIAALMATPNTDFEHLKWFFCFEDFVIYLY